MKRATIKAPLCTVLHDTRFFMRKVILLLHSATLPPGKREREKEHGNNIMIIFLVFHPRFIVCVHSGKQLAREVTSPHTAPHAPKNQKRTPRLVRSCACNVRASVTLFAVLFALVREWVFPRCWLFLWGFVAFSTRSKLVYDNALGVHKPVPLPVALCVCSRYCMLIRVQFSPGLFVNHTC